MKTYRFVLRLYGWLFVAGMSYLVIMAGSVEELHVEWTPTPHEITAETLIADHGCWTGSDAPKDVIPGRAVVDVGNGPEMVASDVGFGIWLDGDPGILYAFCP